MELAIHSELNGPRNVALALAAEAAPRHIRLDQQHDIRKLRRRSWSPGNGYP
jgi:hypothetical protein